MTDAKHDHPAPTPAEVYEALFVPALMQPWTTRVADAAAIGPDQRVLDIACGTGILARHLVDRVGSASLVTGVDANEGMLAVARDLAPDIAWRRASAERLPFPDATFDAVVSQFGLMFFPHREATAEMARMLRPGGRLAVAVWGPLRHCPGYDAFATLVSGYVGEEAAAGTRAAFALGDPARLLGLFTGIGLADVTLVTAKDRVRFPSVASMVRAEVDAWGLGDMITDEQAAQVLQRAEDALAPFVTPDGAVTFPITAHIVSARNA